MGIISLRDDSLRIALVVRVIAAAHLTYGLYYEFFCIKPPSHLKNYTTGGKFKYMTNWNLCLETVYFWFAIVDSLVSECSDNEKKPLRKIRDHYFLSVVFPLSSFVSFTFWVLFAVDRELVMPKAVDQFFPSWLNHTVHTFIVVYSVLELLTSYHRCTQTIYKQCVALWIVTILYVIWCHIVHYQTNLWVYPILNELSFPFRMLFFLGCLLLATVFLTIGFYGNNSIWKRRIETVPKKQKKIR
ncbi:androgen-induced gene 1 protein-like isoform X2 [Planococcus citri]|uniref:androgen-induced gene 1 protein-like isoform X2 n=1 Tax=Planococcus citri TaxID=170843 RepID=UPI0031F9E4CF